MKAIIVGGGIGGLTTALMLRARGIGCELFEQSDTIRELGVGGASQAILDARCLADALARSEHPRQALVGYEQKRLPMTAEIVRSNRRGGPEGVIDAVEQLAPDGFDNVENVLSYSQREAIVRGYASKAGFAAVPGLTAVRA
jgi:2-polyprenyl-6-methoxyphenol hydroxylase-like FAD-dependent oxidoreductase